MQDAGRDLRVTLLHELLHAGYAIVGDANNIANEEGHVELQSHVIDQVMKQWHKFPDLLQWDNLSNKRKPKSQVRKARVSRRKKVKNGTEIREEDPS